MSCFGCAHPQQPTPLADPAAVTGTDAVVICVPTPVDRELVPDPRALTAACASVGAHAVPGQLLVLTSTSHVGTTRDLLVEPLAARGLRPGSDVFVAFTPSGPTLGTPPTPPTGPRASSAASLPGPPNSPPPCWPEPHPPSPGRAARRQRR
ncbi:hypothetical protein AB0D13_28365 [Streptomyces sp. NPDC048430]|uniref:hypothetical protein n=1 Tax=Streptomyces sp. NPDC048430 TaxID=3155388 RepID=UPI003412ADDE